MLTFFTIMATSPSSLIAELSVEPPAEANPSLSDPGSDTEDDERQVVKAPKDSEKRRLQNAKFSAWLSKQTENITKDEVQAVIENANEETLSIRGLMAKQESDLIITSPREYQLELFEKARKQNIIAVLDTGLCYARVSGLTIV